MLAYARPVAFASGGRFPFLVAFPECPPGHYWAEPEMEARSDDELRALTAAFKARLERGEDLDDVMPEAFATVREAAKRVLGQRHYDVQLLAGVALVHGAIVEMQTGEGKTLVATLPAYLNAIAGTIKAWLEEPATIRLDRSRSEATR